MANRPFEWCLMVVCLTGCGGTWSNTDLEFVSALPVRSELKVRLPSDTGRQGLGGPATRRDGLNAGEPSTAYADARKAQADYNGLIDVLLVTIDTVRQLPPTTRTGTSRTWGPWPDKNNPGTEFRVTIERGAGEEFDWAIEARRSGEAYFDVVRGSSVAADTVRNGRGRFVVEVASFRDRLAVPPEMADLDRISTNYAQDVFPTHVDMRFDFRAGSDSKLSAIGYAFDEWADRSGRLAFRLTSSSGTIDYTLDWLGNGAGRSVGEMRVNGNPVGQRHECWDRAFIVTYYSEPGFVSGSSADCVVIAH